MQLSPEEQQAAISAFADPAKTQAGGIRLCGQKYFTISVSDRSVYGKQKVRARLAPYMISDAQLTTFLLYFNHRPALISYNLPLRAPMSY